MTDLIFPCKHALYFRKPRVSWDVGC